MTRFSTTLLSCSCCRAAMAWFVVRDTSDAEMPRAIERLWLDDSEADLGSRASLSQRYDVTAEAVSPAEVRDESTETAESIAPIDLRELPSALVGLPFGPHREVTLSEYNATDFCESLTMAIEGMESLDAH